MVNANVKQIACIRIRIILLMRLAIIVGRLHGHDHLERNDPVHFKILPMFFDVLCLVSFAVTEVPANTYWRSPFNSLCSTKQLTDYTVLEMDMSISRGMQTMKSKVSSSDETR